MTNFTTPVGRLVQGSLYTPNTKNAEGKPLQDKAGNPRNEFFFALAIPKDGATPWNQTEWGKAIWAAGVAGDVHAGNRPTFAWKVADGDSQMVDQKGKKNCDRDGFPGHWVLRFTGGYAPKLYTLVGVSSAVELIEKDAIPLGSYVQVNANVKFNGSSQQPGVYLNHSMVCLCGFGPRIAAGGPDVAAAGFGGAPLPAGASTTPVGGAMPPAPAPAVAAPAVVPPPAPAFRMVPPPAAPARVMLPAAQGATYEQCIAAGWTDALLIEHKMMAG